MSDSYYTRLLTGIRDFLRFEGWAGIVLGLVTILALIASNSGLASLYNLFLDLPVEARIGSFAIAIIAVFYTADLSVAALLLAAGVLALMFILNRLGVTRTAPYALLGILLWVCVLKSGVHATLAGVAMALAIPMRADNGESLAK